MGGKRIQERACNNPSCGKLFKPKKPDRLYCSHECALLRMSHRHSPEICEEVTRLLDDGLSCRKVGEKVGLSTEQVEGIKRRHYSRHCGECNKPLLRHQSSFCSRDCYFSNMSSRNENPEFNAKLTELWDAGLSMSAIGERMHLGKNSVVGKVHRLGLPPRPSPIRPRKEIPDQRFKTPFCMHELRAEAGHEPLPPMHPISWGAIAL